MVAIDSAKLLPRLFLHFLDRYHYVTAKESFLYQEDRIFAEMRLAFRLSFLMAERVYLSASAYFENRLTRLVINEHRELCDAGHVIIAAEDASAADHFEKKRSAHYGMQSPVDLQESYREMRAIPAPYESVDIATHEAIVKEWQKPLVAGDLVTFIDPRGLYRWHKDIEEKWDKIPDVIGTTAFVPPHILRAFDKIGVPSVPAMPITRIVDVGYTLSHAAPLDAGVVDKLIYLQLPWNINTEHKGYAFSYARDVLAKYGLLSHIEQCNAAKLLELKLSPEWSRVVPALTEDHVGPSHSDLRRTAAEIRSWLASSTSPRGGEPVKSHLPRIGIITALPEEWTAVVKSFQAKETASPGNDPNRYALAKVRSRGSQVEEEFEVIVTFLPRMGNNSAATAATNLLRSYPDINDLVFVGIACGCPNPGDIGKHVRLGDIVVSDDKGIVQLDIQAVKPQGATNRSVMPPPSRRLLNAVRLLAADRLGGLKTWEQHLSNLIATNAEFKRPSRNSDVLLDENGNRINHPTDPNRRAGTPRVFSGAIGSSSTLYRDYMLRDDMAHQFNLRAIEMEGAGTAEAVWQFGKSYLIVRGICDYGDDRTKDDKWHNYAAAAAAAYAKAVVERLLLNGGQS